MGYDENADFWVKIIRNDLDRYRTELTNDAVLQAVGEVDGKDVLDAGCGEGYLSRILARRGARAVGIDVCEPLIEAARTEATAEGLPIAYNTADVARIPAEDSSFDVVVCNHVVTDIEHPETPFAEFTRVLRPSGRLVIMMLHPCFYSAHAERSGMRRYATPQEYFAIRTVEQEFVVADITSPARVRMWFRPLEAYVSLITGNGLSITGMAEPHPPLEKLSDDQWWRTSFTRPLFLLITAEKR